jgi:ethanolamine utilization protein EutN
VFLGRVIGQVWATRKSVDLEGKRLLVVEALDERRNPGAPKVTPVVAADPLGAAVGEHVLVAFGKAARVACGGDGDFALEAAIVGIVDDFDVPSAPEHWRMEPPVALAGKGGKG